MASRIAPIANNAEDADSAVEDAEDIGMRAEALYQANIPPDRWLHSETVDELRQLRARKGLPVPRSLKSVPRPPFTMPSEPLVATPSPIRILAAGIEPRLAHLRAITAGVAREVTARINATIAVLRARSLSLDRDPAGGE